MRLRLELALGILCVCCADITAAPPTIESVSPGVGQRGTEFTLSITGARLTNPRELMLYSPGVVCASLTAKSENEVTAKLKTTQDCVVGLHAFRLRTTDGASEVRTFHISAFPVVEEVEPNDTPTKAQRVTLNTTVAGIVEQGDVDYFAVALKKGQRLAAEVEAIRLGVELTDTALAIIGPDGQQITAVDDTALFRQDPFATIVAPVDGTYLVQVRDTNYGGGDNNRYLLHIGSFPRPTAVFPPGGQAGTELAVKLIGDAVGDRTMKVKLPPAGGSFRFYPSDSGGTAPTPNPFRVSLFANMNEVEPNDDLPQANAAVAWPVAFNGIINKPGDVDHFRFRAKQGDEIDVQAFALRIGSLTDTVVAVLDARGELIAANDDDETHDSRIQVTIPADGEYFVRVTDKRRQGGPGFIYRVELDKPTASLAVFLPERVRKSQERQVIAVPRGNRVTAFLAVRRDGFTGPVTLTHSELPAGVKLHHTELPASEYLLPILFEAAPDAPLTGKLVSFIGTESGLQQQARGGFTQEIVLVRGPGDSGLCRVALDKLAIVVVDDSPLNVALLPPTTSLAADGTLDVTVRITRRKDFTEPVAVTFPCLPPGVEVPTTVIIPANKTEATVTLVASKDAELGNWKLVAEASIARSNRGARDPSGGTSGRRPRRVIENFAPVASELRTLRLAASPVNGTFTATAGEQGKTVKVICKLDPATPLRTGCVAKLDGLPPRTTSSAVSVQANDNQIEFVVKIDPTTPPGEYQSLVCELNGIVGGQKVVFRVGRGGALKVDTPGAAKTDVNGKPLSPLDALRMQEKKQSP